MEKSNGVVKLWDREFRKAKSGLDQEQVVSFVDELISERDILVKRQEHLSSLAQLAERTVAEADNVAKQIQEEAVAKAKDEAKAIKAKAEEQARQVVEEKRAEIIAVAEKEAEAIKDNAQQQAEVLLEKKTKRIQSELRDTALRLYRELVSQLENLKQQVTVLEADFERTLFQPVEQINPAMEEDNNVIPDTESEVSPEATLSTSVEAMEPSLTTDQSDTSEPEIKALVSAETEETTDYEREVELEILPPVDISKVMGLMTYLDNLSEVETTELIPVIDKPLIIVFLREPVNLVEVVGALPEVEQVREVTDEEFTATDGNARAEGKRRKIQVTFSGKSVLDEAKERLDGEVSHTISS